MSITKFKNSASKNEHNFELLLRNFRIILAHTDRDLRYTWIFNPISDIDILSNKHLGMRDDEIGSSDGARQLMEIKREVLESGKGKMEEILIPCQDEIRVFKVQVEPLKSHNGDIIGVMSASLEITEYKKVQNELIHNYKLSAVGELAAGIIHEFKNILATIMGNVQILIKKNSKLNLHKELVSRLKIIEDQSMKANEILSSIMAVSSYHKLHKQKSDIRKIVDNILKLQNIHLESENIEVVKDYSNIPELYIDTNQIEEVFLNMIINARHALKDNKKGQIKISIREEDQFIKIILKDNGCGMDRKTQENIFKPFFTTKDNSSKDGLNGSGLGLSLTKRIIEDHNGTISVESNLNMGTTFVIKLPK